MRKRSINKVRQQETAKTYLNSMSLKEQYEQKEKKKLDHDLHDVQKKKQEYEA